MKESGVEIPYGLRRLFGPPPAILCKAGVEVPPADPNPPVKPAGAKNISHTRGASAVAALGGSTPPTTKPNGGGFQGYGGERSKAPVLPPPKF